MTLSDYSTDELMDELMARADIGVLALMFIDKQEGTAVRKRWKGQRHACAGLGMDVGHAALHDFESNSIGGPPRNTGESDGEDNDEEKA